MPLSLTEGQLSTITKAAALLPPSSRDNFLRSVAGALAHTERPTDRKLIEALRFVLSERCVAVVTGARQSRRGDV